MSPIVKNKGFALPSALFLLVILTMLGAGLFLMNGYFQKNSIYDTLDAKAYLSAKAGLEYGLYQANKNATCNNVSQTISMTDPYFQGFKFTYTCNASTSDEAGNIVTYYTVSSVGCYTTGAQCPDSSTKPSTEDYAEKSLTATLAK